jgi:hypothetical protein
MALAMYLTNNSADLEACRHIDSENRAAIESRLTQNDWRDELITSLSGEVSKLSFDAIAGDLGGHIRDGKLVIRCIRLDYSLGRDRIISPDTGNKWTKILLFHYVRTRAQESSPADGYPFLSSKVVL